MKNKYHHHNVKTVSLIVGIFAVMCLAVVFLSGNQYQKYLGLTEYPNCMKLDEYGDQGNEKGVRFHTTTLTPDYQDVYSLSFESYYMTSSDTAYNMYTSLFHDFNQQDILKTNEAIVSPTVRVRTIVDQSDKVYFIVQNEHTVFQAYGIYDEMNKKQKWFDVLRIDYQIPQTL